MNVLGVRVDQFSQSQVLERCQVWLKTATTPKLIFTPNPEIVVYAHRHPEFKQLLNTADLALPDGAGIVLAGRGQIKQRVTGADVMLELLHYASQAKLAVSIILPQDGLSSATEVTSRIQQQFPGIIFTGQPALVLVGLGSPAQEQWAVQHKALLTGTKIILTVGGALDFLTGKQHRAPLFLRSIKLEWLWRLGTQPRRLKRIITAVIVFPYLLIFSHEPSSH